MSIICVNPCVNNFQKSTSSYGISVAVYQATKPMKRPLSAIAMHAGKVLSRGKTSCSMQDIFYNSKASSRFPNFDTGNAWQMGHNSREAFFLGQELLLDFAAWIDLTSNDDNMSISSLEH